MNRETTQTDLKFRAGIRMLVTIFVLAATGGCVEISDQEAFYVQDAELAYLDKHKTEREAIEKGKATTVDDDFRLVGHIIKTGRGTVIAIREFTYYFMLVDSAAFEKLTVYVPSGLSGASGEINLSDPDIIAYWSGANSNFHSAGCSGYITDGKIRYHFDEDHIIAQFDLKFAFCHMDWLKEQFEFSKMQQSELMVWHGKEGDTYMMGFPPSVTQ